MAYYLLQTALLMLAAYLLGATLGCVLRRSLRPEVNATAQGETTTNAAPPTLAGETAAAPICKAPKPVQPKIETVAHPNPPQEAKVAESARFERALTCAPAGALAAAAVAAASNAVLKTTSPPRDTAVEPRLPAASSSSGTAKSAVAASIATTADDLRKISGIDSDTANHLNQLGYTRFSQIARWLSEDMARVRLAIGDNRANTGGWIEQAKMLADGKQTGHLKRLAEGVSESPWAVTAAATQLAAPVAVPAAPPAAREQDPDNLGNIRGLDEDAARLLSENGVTTYRQITGWTAADVARFDALLSERGRVSRQNWIEQAKVLADGKDTAFIRRTTNRPIPAKAPSSGLFSPLPLPKTATSMLGIASAAAVATGTAVAAYAEVPQSDDLKRISGINDAAEKMLHGEGIRAFEQIASWKSVDVQAIDRLLCEPGRVSKQNWIEQARMLADGRQTEYAKRQSAAPDIAFRPGSVAASDGIAIAALRVSPEAPESTLPEPQEPAASSMPPQAELTPPLSPLVTSEPDTEPLEPETEPLPATSPEQAPRRKRLADAIRQNAANMGAATKAAGAGVAGMRSVRSQVPSGARAEQPGAFDDLKKIRGIGVLIEKKLNAMGVYSYDQIANWSADDIQRVSSELDFEGRIEHEGWVQQARILASGGQTEFSKRLT